MGKVIRNGCVTIFLNRNCPRRCVYCNVVDLDLDRKKLSVGEWKKAFSILEKEDVRFYLCVGTEPLLLGEDLVEIVKFWKERDYEYGIYTTAPKGVVERLSNRLVEAGLRNWSSGIDFVPEVYEKLKSEGKLTQKCIDLVEKESEGLVRKAVDGLDGMSIMIDRPVEELHIVITVSRMNIEIVPEMISWLVKNLGGKLHIGINYVEVNKQDLDFARSVEQCADYFFTLEDEEVFRTFVQKMRSLPASDWLRIQIPFDYLDAWDHALNLDVPASVDFCAMGVECDGSLRKCGYSKGRWVSQLSVFDIEDCGLSPLIRWAWEKDIEECSGCYWVFPYLLKTRGTKAVNYRSDWWRGRDKVWGEKLE